VGENEHYKGEIHAVFDRTSKQNCTDGIKHHYKSLPPQQIQPKEKNLGEKWERRLPQGIL